MEKRRVFLLLCRILAPAMIVVTAAGLCHADSTAGAVKLLPGAEIPQGDNVLCGVRSVCVALERLGLRGSPQSVLSVMPPGVYGSSMRQILDYFRQRRELECRSVQCTAMDLYNQLDAGGHKLAVMNINDHWIVGRRTTDKGVFEVIDYPRKYFIPVDVVDQLWEGYAVVVRRKSLLSRGQMLGGGIGLASLILVSFVLLAYLGVRRDRVADERPK